MIGGIYDVNFYGFFSGQIQVDANGCFVHTQVPTITGELSLNTGTNEMTVSGVWPQPEVFTGVAVPNTWVKGNQHYIRKDPRF